MTKGFIGQIAQGALAAALVFVVLPAQSPVVAQAAQASRPATKPAPPAPRLPNGRPDLSGVLNGGGGIAARSLKKGDEIVLLPEAKKLMDSRQSKDDPEANCLPTGVPRMNPYPWRIVQQPTHTESTHIFILFEGNVHSYRQIFMDGRPHPDDLVPTWYGHSTGKWEGDTLVVDTVGYNDRFWFDFDGHPHTTALHTIERFTRTDLNTLSWEITIIDPGAYAKPFTVLTKAEYKPGWELMEYICNENNTNVQHIQGPAVSPGGR
jgi:hypothetical protein